MLIQLLIEIPPVNGIPRFDAPLSDALHKCESRDGENRFHSFVRDKTATIS